MADPFAADNWDWPYILYVGRVWLKYSDDELWNMTPRKFKSQLDVHKDVQDRLHGVSPTAASQEGFIDNIPGW